MLRYLDQHPDIAMPQRREPIFFGSDLASHSRRTDSLEDYLAVFSGCVTEKVIGEKSVWYLYSRSAADEIKSFDKTAKILIMLRNPVDMVHSLHQQFLSTGNEDVASFDRALALVEERAAGRALPTSAHFPEGLLYTRVPLYCEQVKRYLQAFGKNQVHVISFDDFAGNTAQAYANTLSFLNVSPGFAPQFVVYNKKKKPLLKGLAAGSPALPFRLLPDALQQSLRWRLHRLNRVEERRAPLSAATRGWLQDRFRPDIERLSILLDRDFTHWCRREPARVAVGEA